MALAWARGLRLVVCMLTVVLICGLVSVLSAQAQTNNSKISFTSGSDFLNAYFFRGIRQEHQGVIAQPYFDINFNLYDNSDGQGLTGLNVSIGQWNSLHSGPSGSGRAADDQRLKNTLLWYEADFFTNLALTIDNWEAGFTYTSYLSPNDSFGTVQELAIGLSMDDSTLLGSLALSPHVLLAIETSGQADGGNSEGVYLELGIEPGVEIISGTAIIGFPITLGFSLNNYYENGLEASDTLGFADSFGYFDAGIAVNIPVKISENYGIWEVSGSLHLISLGSYLGSLNDGKKVQTVSTFGLSIGY